MIVVVASSYDARARKIVAHWGSQCATMLTAEDLSMSGWRLAIPYSSPDSTAVAGGKIVRNTDIEGILTLRPCIFPEELSSVHSSDRKYVAVELNAFLLAWISAQSCPVVNRPTPNCLAGPNWRPEQWRQAALALGIPARTDSPETVELILACGQFIGVDDPVLRQRTKAIADFAQVELLAAHYSVNEGEFVSASPWPALTDAAVLDSVRSRFGGVQ